MSNKRRAAVIAIYGLVLGALVIVTVVSAAVGTPERVLAGIGGAIGVPLMLILAVMQWRTPHPPGR